MEAAIETVALRKVYPAPKAPGKRAKGSPKGPGIEALKGLDLRVERGEFFGLLGPNGAGKTTTIGILTTRVRATAGEARIDGVEVSAQPVEVRRRIGVVPQRPNPDRALNVQDNLLFHASYFGIPRSVALPSAQALMERLGFADKALAKVDALSGGQQQRLMIARALIHEPRVVFLDEPTVGLDPAARLGLWEILRELHAQGRTIVMTTHYMEEADQLCDRIAIVDQGTLLALDTPAALRAQAPGATLVELTLDGDAEPLVAAASAVAGVERAEARGVVLRVFGPRGGEPLPALIGLAEGAGRAVKDIQLARPSLETLFISLTGRKLA